MSNLRITKLPIRMFNKKLKKADKINDYNNNYLKLTMDDP